MNVTRKIGQNRGKPRLWIKGQVLREAGLTHGTRWDLIPNDDGFLIKRNYEGKRKIAGTPERPIIDISGGSIPAVLADARIISVEPPVEESKITSSIFITLGAGNEFGISDDNLFIRVTNQAYYETQTIIDLGPATKENLDRLIINISQLRIHME